MTKYNLLSTANQSFFITQNGNSAVFRIRSFRGLEYIDITIPSIGYERLSVPAIANQFLLDGYGESLMGGQFAYISTTGEYPSRENVNTPESLLVYIPKDDIEIVNEKLSRYKTSGEPWPVVGEILYAGLAHVRPVSGAIINLGNTEVKTVENETINLVNW